MFSLFLTFSGASGPLPSFRRALLHAAGRVKDPLLDDGAPPARVVQAYFATLPELEQAAAANAALACSAEAMSVRRIAVPEPGPRQQPWCTYLVAYQGPAQNEPAWHEHYLDRHAPLMARLPGIRELEIYLPLNWACPAGWREERHMQRNKIGFDSGEALAAALASPERARMRAGAAGFPPYSGRVTHFPMETSPLA